MSKVSREIAVKVLYWNAVAFIIVVCLAASSLLRRLHQYDRLIVEISREHSLPPRLVASVIWKESRFDHTQVGKAGEIGLMQVTQITGGAWAEAHSQPFFRKTDLFNPEINIQAGAWYLARARKRWKDAPEPLAAALAEYNAGYSNASRWMKKAGDDNRNFIQYIDYPTTQRYVRDVLKRFRGKA